MTCKDCIHYEPCFEYGNILGPIHGGIICNSFKNKADFAEIKHGKWLTDRFGLDRSICSVCNATYEGDGGNYCRKCGAKMDKENEK